MTSRLSSSASCRRRTWFLLCLPVVDYQSALALQQQIMADRIDGRLRRDVLILLQHRPVFTVGKHNGLQHLTVTESYLRRQNIPLEVTERGGSITYHGPGQVVAYPIIHLHDNNLCLQTYIDNLEEVMIRTAADFGIRAGRCPKNRGVWLGRDKIGAIGIRVRRQVTMHGLALNVSLDLTPFSWIVPCGLHGTGVTSLARAAARSIAVSEARESMIHHFQQLFGIELNPVSRAELCSIRHAA